MFDVKQAFKDIASRLGEKAESNHDHPYLPLVGGTLTGALNGTSAAFSDSLTVGDKNVSLEGHTHNYLPLTGGTLTGSLTVNGALSAKNGLEIYHKTPYIDFHFGNSTEDYTSRIIETASGTLNVSGNLTVGGTAVSKEGHYHNDLYYKSTGTRVCYMTVSSSGDVYMLRPVTDGGVTLGTTEVRWNRINANVLATYDTTTTSNGVNARIYSNRIYRYSSSSERYKHDIAPITAEEIAPEKLYDAEVVQFKYKDGYLMDDDVRSDKLIPGFIVEDLEQIYPIAIDYNEDGTPEMWNANIMIPPILKLVQDLNKRLSAVERSKKEN